MPEYFEKFGIAPVIVCGIARSGTSAVARVLHENMGINMAQEFKPPDWRCPDGHYECAWIKSINDSFLAGNVSFPQWQENFVNYIKMRMSYQEPWGFKDPKVAFPLILGWLMGTFPAESGVKFVRPYRDLELVIKSNMRCWGMTESLSRSSATEFNRAVNNVLGRVDHIRIDMTERLSDEEIKQQLIDGGING